MGNFKYSNSILIHEHVFNLYPPSKKQVNTKFTLSLLEQLVPYDVSYVVDLTPYANLNRYLEIIDTSPIPIICCIGFSYGKHIRSNDKKKSEDELYSQMQRQYSAGISKRKITPGIIKLATNTSEIKDYERRFMAAAIKLSNERCIPIAYHCPFNTFANYCELLRMGVNPSLLMICHYENQYKKLDCHEFFNQARTIVSNGTYMQLNDFGTITNSSKAKHSLYLFQHLISSGYCQRILLSSDCNWTWNNGSPKLKTNNMNLGYNYLFDYSIPLIETAGIVEEDISTILSRNPRRFLHI